MEACTKLLLLSPSLPPSCNSHHPRWLPQLSQLPLLQQPSKLSLPYSTGIGRELETAALSTKVCWPMDILTLAKVYRFTSPWAHLISTVSWVSLSFGTKSLWTIVVAAPVSRGIPSTALSPTLPILEGSPSCPRLWLQNMASLEGH